MFSYLFRIGAHIIHSIAMKLSQVVVNMLVVVLEILISPNLKIVLGGIHGVALHSNLDEILHISPSKQEESHCLHDHPPFSVLLAGVPGPLMSLETTTCAINLKCLSFINIFPLLQGHSMSSDQITFLVPPWILMKFGVSVEQSFK